MIIVSVTGNIGSGKSTVCQILARLGATIIDADELAHETYKPHSQTWQELINTFGKDIAKANEKIDRQKLGQIVFSHPEALAKLNQIVHPRTYGMAQEKIEDYRRQGAKAIVVEATLLIEAGWTDLVDKVWLVVTPEDVAIQRLTQHKGISKAQILARLKAQMPAEEKMKYADEVIYNAGSLNQLEAKVTELWHKLHVA
ncbi:MAG: dephospho-CoA kinase [Dehalococcoidia bacterium]|nr:dephospho-CoA kinase [Dehalococcoidia bacterium]